MSIEERHAEEATVLKVDGDLAGPNAAELREVATRCLSEGKRDFIIDLEGANTCDSAGLEALTWLQQQCDDHLGLVRLAATGENIKKILEMTRLEERFEGDLHTF